ncbi:MAG: CvpA family protein [Spartobacteria bacterium]|nr:CvpA family protein [Spartobacteria bacterium]
METTPLFNLVDIFAVLVVLPGIWQGWRRGLSGEIARVVSAVASFWAGWHYYARMGYWLTDHTRLNPQEALAVAFVAIILGAFLLTWVVRIVLKHIIEFTFKERIEKAGGALAGGLRTAMVVAAIIFFIGLLPNDYLHRTFAENSLIGRQLDHYIPTAYETLAERYPELPPLPLPRADDSTNHPKRVTREEFFHGKETTD